MAEENDSVFNRNNLSDKEQKQFEETLKENNEDEQSVSSECPADIKDWNKNHVREWMLRIKVDKEDAEMLYTAKINGASLLLLEKSDLTELGLSLNAKILIIHNRDQLKQNKLTTSCSGKPYPFKSYNTAHKYKENIVLDVPESGTTDYIQPCHEFKAFTNTSEDNEMTKYRYEVIRFAAACMNSRTNGTIHFGVADDGKILGVSVQNRDGFTTQHSKAIKKHFQKEKHFLFVKRAKMCIMPPRFVEVLKDDMTSTGKYVIEVDIEPSSRVCNKLYFHTLNLEKDPKGAGQKGKKYKKSFFIRDSSNVYDLIKSEEYSKYIADMSKLSQLRKEAEEKNLCDVKNNIQGLKLCEMLTGGTQSLDKSHFTCLWSENRKSDRFLPGVGGSKVVLSKKTEDTLDLLSILCVNQCDGGNEDKQPHEERFYRGGKVSWWNFFFSEQPGSVPFIKRDKFEYIIDVIIPDLLNMKRACVFFNIFHLPGCGGTTLAMHVLWTLKNKYRCAVLKYKPHDLTKVAQQVVQLLTYEAKEQQTRLPVLLMIDDFDKISDVETLQKKIEEECQKENNSSKSPQFIVLNCMKVDSGDQAEENDNSVYLGNNLFEKEQRIFDEKLNELKRTYTNTNTFHGFMYLQTNGSSEYLKRVVENTLKGFNFQDEHAQLFAVLVLLSVYCRNALLSVSACEEFLHLPITEDCRSCKAEDGFKEFSALLTRCIAASNFVFEGMRVINSCVAQHFLDELAATHGVTKANIMNTLVTTFLGNDLLLGKQKLMQDVHGMLVKSRPSTKSESLFSPLINDIMKETPGREENILLNATKVYKKDAVMLQLLASYYYLKKREEDFNVEYEWSFAFSKDNSYICDTVARVLKGELRYKFQQDRDDPIKPDSLEMYLTLAESATNACRESQKMAHKEDKFQFQRPNYHDTFNTFELLCEHEVAVKVIEILQKTPPFTSDDQLLGQVLSGKIKMDDLTSKQPKLKEYSDVLSKHMHYILDLEPFVNLDKKDKLKEPTHDTVNKCSQQRIFDEINRSILHFEQLYTTCLFVFVFIYYDEDNQSVSSEHPVDIKDRNEDHNNEHEPSVSSELPEDIKDWNKDHVREWILKIKVDQRDADILYNEGINGAGLLLLEISDLTELGLSLNAKKLIIHNRDQRLKMFTCRLKPYPFKRFNAAHRYQENFILDVIETGPYDLIQPCHEFKKFTDTPKEKKITKYTFEVIKFAAACMNSRTNGTIHFGVKDKPHGLILGFSVQDLDFTREQTTAIEKHFQEQFVEIAKRCIMPPRFVEVLKADMTSTGKFVIEVDIEPSFIVCEKTYFKIYKLQKGEETYDDVIFVRNGNSSKSLPKKIKKEKLRDDMEKLSQLRKNEEEKHLTDVRMSSQGLKLCNMLTGGTGSLDMSHFTCYVVVTNKSHPSLLENLKFLIPMKLMAVLDFDPESAENGLKRLFKERKTNNHLPSEYEITQTVQDTADKLKLTRNTSWVFCNGGFNGEDPSDSQKWSIEKGASVRHPVYFLCRKDVMPNKKFLIVFLLLNQVTDGHDPMLETLHLFCQELHGENQILCICDNETTYNLWKDLIMGRYKVDISKRCIFELSFAEINGTVLSLWSENRKSDRFLPGVGGSQVVLSKKTEDSLHLLSILCVNQCDGGNEDKKQHEESFYIGGKVSWWNFYFSEQAGSVPFIKRDKFEYIIDVIIPDLLNMKRACVFFNIFHLPGCGGTTLAMHVLWTLKNKYRCAALKYKPHDLTKVAEQVVKLLTYKAKKKKNRLPVLLMIEDFDKISDVETLQEKIEEECQKENNSSKSPQVILLNCMKVESRDQAEDNDNFVYLGNELFEKEQKFFDEKLKELKRTYTNTDTFHGFMYLQTNGSSEYLKRVVENTLKGFNFQDEHAQLFAVLVLLSVYCRNALLSVSACVEFLHQPITEDCRSCKAEDGFKEFSALLTRCTPASHFVFEGMRVINSCVAQHCLDELAATHGVTKANIMNTLLTTFLGYDLFLGKQKLMQDVHSILLKSRHSTKSESTFSPLIHDIMKETPGREENILLNATKVYKKDAVILQLLASYYYLKRREEDFNVEYEWSFAFSKDNSYICDTVARVLKGELWYKFQQDRDNPTKPDSLEMYLTLAESATNACRESQKTTHKEDKIQFQRPNYHDTYNTAEHHGEHEVALKVIEILQKTPPFTSDHQLLGQLLSGKIKMDDLTSKQPKLKEYSDVLSKHIHFILDLEPFVNLDRKDKLKEPSHDTVNKCSQQRIFDEINRSELVKNIHLNDMIKEEKTLQDLERNKTDSLYRKRSPSTLKRSNSCLNLCQRKTSRTPSGLVLGDVKETIYSKCEVHQVPPEPYTENLGVPKKSFYSNEWKSVGSHQCFQERETFKRLNTLAS
ncbi:Sterile alpha motif domain-containing protein 9 [Triplophysa tibetana]|uniref:Sterile alpha motif domain-containing protein 9 n=1 Tax=Triplophysa tibetana TaxID=1572043 RepID=A0A5A9N939_9TELE|nr:Sterile alpha motif domain-containing protein 9 [Triplophysa tibetana]